MKVKNMKYLLFVLLLVVVLITAGCISGNQNVVAAPTATPASTITIIPTIIPTLIQTAVITGTPNVTIVKNVTAKPTAIQDTAVIDDIVFSTWLDRFVSIKYPNTWTAENRSAYNSTMLCLQEFPRMFYLNNCTVDFGSQKCKPVRDFCYKWFNEEITKPTTPWVTISNPNKTVAYKVSVEKIGTGAWIINENPVWVYEEVQAQFPNNDPRSITGLDKECSIDGISSCMKYTVTIPNIIKLFRYKTVTSHYGYTFELSSANATIFDNYKNLGEYMTNTIEISDTRTT